MQRLNWRILGSALALVCTLASFSTVLNTSVAAATPRGESTYLQADPQKQDDARWISEPTVSSVAVDVGIPDAISEFVVEHWIQLLRLQGEDASRTRVALVAFAEREAIEVPKIFGRATLLAQSLALGPAQHPTPEFTASFELLLREKARAMGRLAALEEELFAALSTESDDAGEASVGDLLRQYRRRILAMTYSCDLRMARVDLREVALALEAAALLKPLDVPAWSSVWLGYDLELAALHEQRVRSQMRCMVEDQKYHQSTGYDSQLLTQRRTAGIERQLRPERAIIAANRHWTEHLCGMLSPDSAVAFRDSVDAALYPSIYPRPFDLRTIPASLVVEAEKDRELIESTRDEIASLLAELERAEKRAEAEEMKLAVSEARGIIVHSRRERLETELAALGVARCTIAKKVIVALLGLPKPIASDAVHALERAASGCP